MKRVLGLLCLAACMVFFSGNSVMAEKKCKEKDYEMLDFGDEADEDAEKETRKSKKLRKQNGKRDRNWHLQMLKDELDGDEDRSVMGTYTGR